MRAATIAIVLCAAGTAEAGNGVFVPPMRIDVGAAVTGTDDRPAFQMVAGLHWASVYPRGLAGFDVGLGLVVVNVDDGPVPAMAPGAARLAPAEQPMSLLGGYAEVATRPAGNDWWRTWIGTRIESGQASLGGADHGYVGAAVRVSTEAYLAGAGGGGDAVGIGVLAIGVYGEVSVRRIDDVGDDLGVSAGVSFRLPLIVAH